MTRTEKDKMLAGELYVAAGPELEADCRRNSAWMDRFNSTNSRTAEASVRLLKEGLGKVGENVNIRPPFYCDYGYNIEIGENVFLNFNCVVLDVVKVVIGDRTQIGSGVQILTADHPRDPKLREQMMEFGRPVSIGSNVWIGSGAIILPGVTIGDNATIGAGSIVTRDVPANATAVGNPARIKI